MNCRIIEICSSVAISKLGFSSVFPLCKLWSHADGKDQPYLLVTNLPIHQILVVVEGEENTEAYLQII
jgi:hypothetical protein